MRTSQARPAPADRHAAQLTFPARLPSDGHLGLPQSIFNQPVMRD
jgi:hypothetical protein